MNDYMERVNALIGEQQEKLPKYHPAQMVGEHLKQIAREDPHCAELLAEDLRVSGKGITDAEKQIKARADELEKIRRKEQGGNGGVGVMPWEAEDILRQFYGLPERTWGPDKEDTAPTTAAKSSPQGEKGKIIDILDFL